jgi:hypothetical protein
MLPGRGHGESVVVVVVLMVVVVGMEVCGNSTRCHLTLQAGEAGIPEFMGEREVRDQEREG